MVNQLGKFVPGLADINAPLRQLLHKDSAWYWGEAQQTALQQVKEKLASPEVLAHYDPNRTTVIAADASSTGLGAVLLQIQDNGQCCSICYISRSLSDAEKNYAVIEKEALASTWACERLEEYVLGLRFTLETDLLLSKWSYFKGRQASHFHWYCQLPCLSGDRRKDRSISDSRYYSRSSHAACWQSNSSLTISAPGYHN